MRNGHAKISRAEFYRLGGFSNPDLFRKQRGNGSWEYFRVADWAAA